MRVVVKDTSSQFLASMQKQASNIQFATVVALTRTAQAIKQAEVELMQRKLDRPTAFTLNSLQVKPATKANPEAIVETKTGFGSVPAGRFLSPLVEGGTRRHKSSELQLRTQGTASYWVPGEFADLDAHGNIKGSTINKILSQLKMRRDATQNASGSKRSKSKRKREAFFIRGNIVFLRVREGSGKNREDQTKPYLFLIKPPKYKPILPFFETAQEVTDQTLAVEIGKAFDQFAS